MGMCGPAAPCSGCREIYEKDERYIPNPDPSGDAFLIAIDVDRRKRRPAVPVTAVMAKLRLPALRESKRATKARRRAKQRRRS